jgi:hypothetical protein
MVSHTAWYAGGDRIGQGIPHGMVSHTAWYPTRHGTQAGIAWGKVSVFDKSGIAEAKMFALWEESAGRSLHCVLTHPLTQRLQALALFTQRSLVGTAKTFALRCETRRRRCGLNRPPLARTPVLTLTGARYIVVRHSRGPQRQDAAMHRIRVVVCQA